MITRRKKIVVIFGTRPEAIKLAPVILALKRNKRFKCRVVVTAQHREMLDQVLDLLNIKPDIDLNLMKKNQTLAGFAAKALIALDKCFKKEKPDIVIVQGDTTTTWVASMVAYYNHIRIGHVEAGLRTDNKYSPFPEEINRILTTHLADLHFAPTKWAAQNLIKEGIPKSKIFVTGNTVIDALQMIRKKLFNLRAKSRSIPISIPPVIARAKPVAISSLNYSITNNLITNMPFVLITGHRRENFGQGFRNICRAIKTLAKKFPNYLFIYPVHLNPNVRKHVMKGLKGAKNMILIDPVDYLSFVWLMDKCTLILTDSGGIQEEAPAFGKPVLVMRNTTERPEAVWAGMSKLVGTDPGRIVREVSKILNRRNLALNHRHRSARSRNPFGDGNASKRISNILLK